MAQEKGAVPTHFRGLGVLLVDNDTESLLDIALKLENFSYKVTTTELATVALSILQERPHNFDLVMADTNMPEMDCFKFIKNVHLIKDFPIILMYSELKKDMVIEAATKEKCFCLKKPISVKNLKNVWQYVYRKSKYENIAEFGGAQVEEEGRVLNIGNNLKIDNDLENVEDGKSLKRKSISKENGKSKGKRVKPLRKMDGEENEILEKRSPSQDLLLKLKEFKSPKQDKEAHLERVASPITKLDRATSLPSYLSILLETSLNPNKKRTSRSVNSSPRRGDVSSSLPEVLVDLQKQLHTNSKLDELKASAAFPKLLQEKGAGTTERERDTDEINVRWADGGDEIYLKGRRSSPIMKNSNQESLRS